MDRRNFIKCLVIAGVTPTILLSDGLAHSLGALEVHITPGTYSKVNLYDLVKAKFGPIEKPITCLCVIHHGAFIESFDIGTEWITGSQININHSGSIGNNLLLQDAIRRWNP